MKALRNTKSLPFTAILAAVFCNILFGSAVPMIKLGYAYCGITDGLFAKILYAGVRFFFSGVILMLWLTVRKRRPVRIERGNRTNVLLLALSYTFCQYLFMYIGYSNTSGALASVLSSVSAFIAVIVAHFVCPDSHIRRDHFRHSP